MSIATVVKIAVVVRNTGAATKESLIATVVAVMAVSASGIVFAQGPTFDVVSIKRNTGGVVPVNSAAPVLRPEGSLALKNVSINTLIARAYPGTDIVGLPDWRETRRWAGWPVRFASRPGAR